MYTHTNKCEKKEGKNRRETVHAYKRQTTSLLKTQQASVIVLSQQRFKHLADPELVSTSEPQKRTILQNF